MDSIDEDHLERMEKLRLLHPEYADKKPMMIIPEIVTKLIEKVFSLLQGDNIEFLNDKQFQPKVW